MTDQPIPSAEHLADWKQAALQRQAMRLEQLSEAGLRLALTIEGEAAQAVAAGLPVRDDAAMTFSRVARAVRMTAMLHSRLIKDMDEALARAAARSPDDILRDEADEALRLDPAGHMQKFRVERIVERVARAACGDDDDRIDRLVAEAGERLDDDDIYGDLLAHSVGELVALICRDLGLDPDWGRLSQEAWARAEGITPERPPLFAAPPGGEGAPFAPLSSDPGAEAEAGALSPAFDGSS